MLHIVPRLSGCIEAVPCCRYAVHATAALTVPSHCPCLYDRCLAAGSCSASYRRCSLCCGKHILEFCAFRICIPGPVSVENPDPYAEILVVPSVIDFSVLEQQVAEQENALCAFLGQTPHRIERGTMERQAFPVTLSVGVPLDLVSRRPDVRQAEAQLMQAFYATNSARSAFYPTITLGGSAGWTNSGGAVVTNPGAWLLSAVGSLVQPLFNRGQNLANLKIAKAQQQEALLRFRQSLLDAGTEVNDALLQCQTARERLQLDAEQVAQLQLTVLDTQLLMDNSSEVDYLQVLAARQSLLSAQLTMVQDRYDEAQGVIRLYHALGGGVD